MSVALVPASAEDGRSIIDIFNHYVENSFAAYPEDRVPYEFFDLFLSMTQGYPFLVAKDGNGKVLGFGLLRPHGPIPAFSGAAEITYFIDPEHTGQGIGGAMLNALLEGARAKGLRTILASISSLNPVSLAFHKKNGFRECGRFLGVGCKRGRLFDVVWMQRML